MIKSFNEKSCTNFLIFKYIFNQIILPAIKIIGNIDLIFPNGHISRHILSYKLLDILLLISLRLGRENTRIEMEQLFRAFFDCFSIHNLTNSFSTNSASASSSVNTNISNSPIKTVTSNTQPVLIANISKQNVENEKTNAPIKSLLTNSNTASSEGYFKLSYNPSNNEIQGSSFLPDKRTNPVIDANPKFRSQSFTLLNFNNDGKIIIFF